jgi:hypothetical protein
MWEPAPDDPPEPDDDPTLLIVAPRKWTEWLFYGDVKGPATKGKVSTGDFPVETPGGARPAIYEIARRETPADHYDVLYVGKATGRSQGVRTRLTDHFTTGDSLYPTLLASVENGDELYARYIQLDDPSEADRLEKQLRDRLRRSRYPWNRV